MTPTPWNQLAFGAEMSLAALREHVRRWAARQPEFHRGGCPGRVVAALDAATRPVRVRLVRLHDHTPRELAEEAYADLWDAAAVVWSMVNAAPGRRGLEHVVAELQSVGRWLGAFPVHAAAHDRAVAELFEPVEVVR